MLTSTDNSRNCQWDRSISEGGLFSEQQLLVLLLSLSLTHWGGVTHICVSNLTMIGSDNGLSPGRRQAIFWTNARILSIGNLGTNFSEILFEILTFSFKNIMLGSIGTLGTNFSEILFEILTFSFKNMRLKMSSGKWRLVCLRPNVLTHNQH